MNQYSYASSFPQGHIEFIHHHVIETTEDIAFNVIDLIVQRAFQRLNKNQFIRKNVKRYSEIKAIGSIDEINGLYFNSLNQNVKSWGCTEKQPTPLLIDSLLPKSAEIDQQNQYKKNIQNNEKGIIRSQSILKKQRSKDKKGEQFLKLNLKDQIDQDGFIKQLRKVQEERVRKQEEQRKIKQIQLQAEKAKNKKKGKDQKISFDYNGSSITVRNQQRSNIISKLIDGNINQLSLRLKQAFNDPNPTTINEFTQIAQKKIANLNLIKKKDEIQLLDGQSLIDGMKVNAGIKYTYEGKTLQQKIKPLKAIQLKKSLSQRRLSKQQYERVKTLNGSSVRMSRQQSMIVPSLQKRSFSESDLLGLQKIKKQRQKIVVNNQQQKKYLLQKLISVKQQVKQDQNPQHKLPVLHKNDIFNMNYLTSRGGPSKSSVQTLPLQSVIRFPKVHRNLHAALLPKERERLKQQSKILFELRKRFDQKLRN